MAYPLDMPSVPTTLNIARCSFDMEPFGSLSRTAGGQIAFLENIGGALWKGRYETTFLNDLHYGVWHAFRLCLRGNGTFKGFDPARIAPAAYLLDGKITFPGGFAGTCTLTAAGGETISLSGLPAGFIITTGDYFSFPWLGGRHLVKALANATASGGGAISALPIAPWLRAGGATGVTVDLVRPYCLMKMVPGTWQGERKQDPQPVSFEAIQHLGG